MDLKSVLLQSEDSLPTLQQNLSISTAAPAPGVTGQELPTVTATPAGYLKFGASTVMGLAGMLFLGYGKKNNDVQKMLLGAALTIGSMFVF
jgi:hypothetical protein